MKSEHIAAIAAVLFLCLVLFPRASLCQDSPQWTTTTGVLFADPSGNSTAALIGSMTTSYISGAGFNNKTGSVEVIANNFGLSYDRFSINYENSRYLWANLQDVPMKAAQDEEPWESLNELTLQVRAFKGSFWKDWHYWINGHLTAAWEDEFPGAVGAGLSGELAYDLYDGWMLGALVKTVALNPLNSDLFGEAEIGFMLHVSPSFLRKTAEYFDNGESQTLLPPKTSISLGFSGREKIYRLSSSSPVEKNGYIGIARTQAGVYVDHDFQNGFSVSGGPEYHFFREYRVYNKSGSLQSSHKLDDAWGGRLNINYSF